VLQALKEIQAHKDGLDLVERMDKMEDKVGQEHKDGRDPMEILVRVDHRD
jgi:hypothetical protein